MQGVKSLQTDGFIRFVYIYNIKNTQIVIRPDIGLTLLEAFLICEIRKTSRSPHLNAISPHRFRCDFIKKNLIAKT